MGCFWSAPSEDDVVVPTVKPQKQNQQPAKTHDAKHGPSPIYDKLPPSAEKHPVRNVYDGDTLTLIDERRVRFLGIDTPEIKEKQAFAQEAKKYTKDLCHKKDIWLTFEPGHDREDHYGRLLAFVWVPVNGKYLNVNEGIVKEGLASVYTPNKASKLHNMKKLLELQKEARRAKRGLWGDFKDFKVLKTANGAAYHVRGCKHLAKSKNLIEINATSAMDEGLHPCRTCLADA
mmetsp:Transcript_95/g.252  ORF Transcript_95/g.252 Transcript_95/m.252 type:complete len:232 (-) Transcript_95:483-1178(-)|eukprot:CAMPEP_0195532354 /NCGR_PEP_ID=MMETSP0794_2-20130614/37875_1 /TAXON_ID=515487 /ORGANISM="Stephanopyxis turris, Strain CCMP 815" /LENGTH=231 /DNA_ID=CAMNT_0040664521 /DNA_START=74 /DNA_END=772 /DNA_ORIENTATION=-